MKKSLWISGFMAVVLMGSTLVARADAPSKDKTKKPEATGDRMEKMKEKLGLTDDQFTKLKAMHKTHMDALQPLMDKLQADMATLKKKIDAKASDSDLKSVLDSITADRKNLDGMKEKFGGEISSILTPTQQAKRLLFQQEKGKGSVGMALKSWKHMKENKKASDEKDSKDSSAGEAKTGDK